MNAVCCLYFLPPLLMKVLFLTQGEWREKEKTSFLDWNVFIFWERSMQCRTIYDRNGEIVVSTNKWKVLHKQASVSISIS